MAPTKISESTLLWTGPPMAADIRAQIQPKFKKIIDVGWMGDASEADLAEADIAWGFLPMNLQSVSQVPRLRFVQAISAGTDFVLKSQMWREPGAKDFKLASSAGVHVGSIPQYFIGTTLALYHRLAQQLIITHNEKRAPKFEEFAPPGFLYIPELRSKTVGILGYGSIGRESARLASAFGANVIAANSNGQRKPIDGYIVPGTGDADGSIPSAWYSTKDPASFASFLAASDVLLCALPSVPGTKQLLNATTLAHLKPSAILINVGRGDLIDTDALVAVLDEGKLAGAALDVTDPEPLPQGHTLFGRNNVIITPHSSALGLNIFNRATEIFLINLERYEKGEELLNAVDWKKDIGV